jgi:hypothetical protein
MELEFRNIDSNGGGQILFDEFCDWSCKKNLDIEGNEILENDDVVSKMIET